MLYAMSLVAVSGCAFAETLDQAIERFLAGGNVTEEQFDAITDWRGIGPTIEGKSNNGTIYLHILKRSILDPVRQGGWPIRSVYVKDEWEQAKTYRELKAIYEKDKSPIVAYALVCPTMYVNDFDLLPELIAKIGENKHLKAHFDKVYATYWKPRLDPDF